MPGLERDLEIVGLSEEVATFITIPIGFPSRQSFERQLILFRMRNKTPTSDLAGCPIVDSTLPVSYHSCVVRLSLSEWDIEIVCFLGEAANKPALTTIFDVEHKSSGQ